MLHLLFVDDDPNISKINRDYFETRGFRVITCENAKQALEHVEKFPVDCIILDIMMPGVGGLELCRHFKSQVTAPVIFLTSLTEKEYLYQGFSSGGDDFLTKPCDLRELEIRINTRISQKSASILRKERLEFPPLVVDISTRQAFVNNTLVPLTAFEFDILLLLARSPGHLFSPEMIYREVWKLPDLETTQTVKVHVARMRHKLEAACPGRVFVGTAWKQGYRFLLEEKKEETS